ncbi:hypothetical protein Tco_0539336 [Tanacetum coccineum]
MLFKTTEVIELWIQLMWHFKPKEADWTGVVTFYDTLGGLEAWQVENPDQWLNLWEMIIEQLSRVMSKHASYPELFSLTIHHEGMSSPNVVDFLKEVDNGNDSIESSDDAYSSEDEIKNDYVDFPKELEVKNANVVDGEHAVNVKVSHNPNTGVVHDHEKTATKKDYPHINFVWCRKKGSIGTQLPVCDPKLNKNPNVGDDGDTKLIGLVEKIESGSLNDVISGLTTANLDVTHALVLELARGFNYVNLDSDTPSEELNMDTPGVDESLIIQALCYPKNDRKDIGMLGAKGDMGFFIGYFANSRVYRVYNQRTKKIMEIINVTFDELLAMAFEQCISKPEL